MTDFITPIKKVRGLGSAKTGVHHWIAQRFTAIVNIILVFWLLCVLGHVTEMDYNATQSYMSRPFNAIFALLFISFSFYHAKLGLQVVIEDYVHCKCAKIFALVAMNIVVFSGIIAGAFWILKIAL